MQSTYSYSKTAGSFYINKGIESIDKAIDTRKEILLMKSVLIIFDGNTDKEVKYSCFYFEETSKFSFIIVIFNPGSELNDFKSSGLIMLA